MEQNSAQQENLDQDSYNDWLDAMSKPEIVRLVKNLKDLMPLPEKNEQSSSQTERSQS